MTHDEAHIEAARLQREHPDRATVRWLAQYIADEEWRVVRIDAPFSNRPAAAHTESRPKPPHAPDPRPNIDPNVVGF
jgi:hypothetical protein